jgi:hypothetical protein
LNLNVSFKKKTTLAVIFLVISLISLISLTGRHTRSEDQTRQTIFKQGNFTFIAEPEVNIKKFSRNISLRRISTRLKFKQDMLSPDLSEAQKDLVWKFYVIYARVQDILNMHPVKQQNVTIHIYQDFNKIKNEFKEAKKVPAFYYHRKLTLFLNTKLCDEHILAHELAHVIICQYFFIEPPANTQEILAIYCDSHLED